MLCLTVLSTRIINGKSFLVNIGKRKDLKTENKKQNKLVLGIQGSVVHKNISNTNEIWLQVFFNLEILFCDMD